MKLLNILLSITIIAILTCFIKNAYSQADLKVDLDFLESTIEIDDDYTAGQCEFEEGCANSVGTIKALRFGTRTMNIGDDDLEIGDPDDNPDLFEFHDCHGHDHFETFANYQLFDMSCNDMGAGHKMGFAIINSENIDGSGPNCFNCSQRRICGGYNDDYQGIGAGCADIYGKFLDCQLIDISNVPDGRYWFKITLNFAQELPESDYSNNSAYLLIEIQGNNLNILYSSHSIPNDVLVENLDNKPPPFNFLPQFTIARNEIEIKGETTIKDNIDREIVAGDRIIVSGDQGRVVISSEQGGSTRLYIDPCLSSGSFKKANDEGLFATLDNSKAVDSTESQNDTELIDNNKENIFKVYPNPTNMEKFTVTLPFDKDKKIEIHIHDTNGRLILEKEVQGKSEITLNLSNQAKGVYSINLLTDKKIVTDLIANF